jgi:hypothetical protein
VFVIVPLFGVIYMYIETGCSLTQGGWMKNLIFLLLFCVFVFPVAGFSYNYGDTVALPDGVKKLLPENPDILASASADLNGDKTDDFVVIIQYKDTDNDNGAADKLRKEEGRLLRELIIITSKEGQYAVAARTKRAVLCSACGEKGEDPFLNIKAVTKSFTILHKFANDPDGAWGIAAKFGYSRRDDKWQLVYLSGHGDTELKPADFGLINLDDFDLDYYMATGKAEPRPDAGPVKIYPDDILYTAGGAAFLIRPDKSEIRYLVGDRFFQKIGHPNWSGDKKRIAFIRDNDMHVMDADGRGDKRLFENVIKIFRYDYEIQGSITGMKWSPDGRYFAITGLRDNSDYKHSCFYIRGIDGVTKTVKECGVNGEINSMCWSPDSSRLAYYCGVTLTIMDINSGVEKTLDSGGKSGLAWSRDGNRLLTVADGGYGVIDLGSGVMRVVKCRAWAGYGPLFWSADEKNALYYSSDYVFMSPVEEGGVAHTIAGAGGEENNGLIDGLSW